MDEDPGLLSDLLCGDEKLQSVEIILSAVRLAEKVRADASLKQAFATETPQKLWQKVEEGALEESFIEAVKHHLHYFGDRGLQELKLEQPSLRDTPWVLMRMIGQYAQQEVTAEQIIDNENAVRREADKSWTRCCSRTPGVKVADSGAVAPVKKADSPPGELPLLPQ